MSLAGGKSYSAHLTRNKQPRKTQTNRMAQKKDQKKDVQVRDLAPKKDAKGGAARNADKASAADGSVRNLDGVRNMDRVNSADGGVRNAD
jgi:hypothetical protein